MACGCKKKGKPMKGVQLEKTGGKPLENGERIPANTPLRVHAPTMEHAPVVRRARTGACPFCLRKHLLRAAGYADEVREDGSREWEREELLKNLLLAEDHALALGDPPLKIAIRDARLEVEAGSVPDIEPLLARAREKVREAEAGEAQPAPAGDPS